MLRNTVLRDTGLTEIQLRNQKKLKNFISVWIESRLAARITLAIGFTLELSLYSWLLEILVLQVAIFDFLTYSKG